MSRFLLSILGGTILSGAALSALATPAFAHPMRSSTSIALGAYIPNAPSNPAALDTFARQTGAMPAIIMWYQAWGGSFSAFDSAQLDTVASRGAVPMITWEPWNPANGVNQPDFSLAKITDGVYDAYITSWAKGAAAWGKALFLRFGHEMNGNWYPWAAGVNSNTAADYVSAWRHIVTIFRQNGATNVRFVWSPNVSFPGSTAFSSLYPGDAFVDWVALDGYNWGSANGMSWQSLLSVFSSSYGALTGLTTRPLMIAETSSNETGGSKAQWITQGLLKDLPSKMPKVRAVVWFGENKDGISWAPDSSGSALSAFQQVAASPLYKGTVS